MNVDQKKIGWAVDKLSAEMVRVARFIGTNPELAFKEFLAHEILTSFLKKNGFEVKKGVGGMKTAFVGEYHRGKGPNIGFLAEYDALPGIGHACGHNLIGASSCGAAIALAKGYPDFSGTITVVGCPAEEGGGGKILLARKGIFKNLSVAMMAHPDSRTEAIKKMLSLIEIDMDFFGRPSHAAAAPEKGINALQAAVFTYMEILKYSKTLSADTRVNGIFTAGGEKPNIIPAHAALKYYVRSLEMNKTMKMIKKMKSIAEKQAKKIGAKIRTKINPLKYEPFHPNRTLATLFKKQLGFLNIKDEQRGETKGIGSSDVGNVGQIVPTIHPMIKICDDFVPHTPQFATATLSQRGYKGMLLAAKALALTGYEVFSNRQYLKKIREEFHHRKRG